MITPDLENEQFNLAVQFVNQTNQHVFLSGKAGTGKTTFLKYIKEASPKKLVVLAPTGVAAMNAGGVTIHSFFQLPFGNFIPSPDLSSSEVGNFFNRRSLLTHLKLTTAKRTLIQELDLLIIDEVSMVRADLLDAIDVVLRSVRRQPYLPFGGVQMLFIGDLFQLPPVVRDNEWRTLSNYYKGIFFFHAQVLSQASLLYLELKKIYRQTDATFINLLNNFRRNEVTKEDFEILQPYYKPTFKPENIKEKYIILTSHNAKADLINEKELNKLPGKHFIYNSSSEGSFNNKNYPAEKHLTLKVGAQIMFIRNDKGEERRYFNGKLAVVKELEDDSITVGFPNEDEELLIKRETWKNVKYTYNNDEEKVEEEVLGTFTQFPVRLAWAITIHKSQGLTFDRAIIDAGSSFAPGQVYVALSRLTSLEGLVLYSPISASCISTDRQAIEFTKNEKDPEILQEELKRAQKVFIHDQLLQVFNWSRIVDATDELVAGIINQKKSVGENLKKTFSDIKIQVIDFQETSTKFTNQLQKLLALAEQDSYQTIHTRVEAAANYFCSTMEKELFIPVKAQYAKIKKKKKNKKDLKNLSEYVHLIKRKKFQLEQVVEIAHDLSLGKDSVQLLKKIKKTAEDGLESKKSSQIKSQKNTKNRLKHKKDQKQT